VILGSEISEQARILLRGVLWLRDEQLLGTTASLRDFARRIFWRSSI
jgi:hypothetical protein